MIFPAILSPILASFPQAGTCTFIRHVVSLDPKTPFLVLLERNESAFTSYRG